MHTTHKPPRPRSYVTPSADRRYHESPITQITSPSPSHSTAIPVTVPPSIESNSSGPDRPPLSILPLSTVLRSLFITTVSSRPFLLTQSLAFLDFVTSTKYSVLDADRNPILRYLLGRTVYDQFCAGAKQAEIQQTIQGLKDKGFAGVVLGFAREVVMAEDEAEEMNKGAAEAGAGNRRETAKDIREITAWKDCQMSTIELAGEGNFVNVKWTGAGSLTLERLLKGLPPSPSLEEANAAICRRAKEKGVRIFIDAEQQAIQNTIDDWTVDLMRRWNDVQGGKAVVYNTYQAYLRSVPSTVARHLHRAKTEGFVLGVKLVRGAYLNSDPRHLMWATKEETDRSYDGIASGLITQSYNEVLRPFTSSDAAPFAPVNLILASHNKASVLNARALRNAQMQRGDKMIEMAYGQLYGMADDISCALVQGDKRTREQIEAGLSVETPKVYKAMIWGSMRDCS
ncbi:proline dehydrogenase, partial [Ascosphaera atra]